VQEAEAFTRCGSWAGRPSQYAEAPHLVWLYGCIVRLECLLTLLQLSEAKGAFAAQLWNASLPPSCTSEQLPTLTYRCGARDRSQ
jgi:hypothetical protein